ncbi:type II secretion system F family protein [Vibrio furnissii]|uniref:type II secretion system F family protein n=1 Tax=Vibrio furnissii TaxID=29494 RepID=UPI0012AE3D93|nr:type II secretion system F family protein [Vibrio furnissii]
MVNSYLLLACAFLVPAYLCFVWSKKVSTQQAESAPSTLLRTIRTHKTAQHHPITERMLQLGFSRSPLKNTLLLGGIVLLSAMLASRFGPVAFPVTLVLSVLIVFTTAQIRRNNIKLQLVQQLPSFVEQVNRRIKVGLSIAQAVEQSASATNAPLKDVLQRVIHRKAVGVELQDAFEKESVVTGVVAFHLLGSIFSINTRYGGSITDSLESLVKLLRQQDLSRRELKSITGETRITAWVIGSAPLLVSAYMLTQNPELLINMWYSEGGRQALILGISLQLLGIILIWRMFRSL